MSVKQEIDVQSLWAEYEKIAMHFNDLLMRLRTQSLAGIAAISALVGLFSNTEGGTVAQLDWLVAEAIFIAIGAFWIAIWCLDLLYYNRLLSGSVRAITKLEGQTKPDMAFDGEIDMSTTIEAEFKRSPWALKKWHYFGPIAFYVIVFLVIVAGGLFSAHMHGHF